MRYLYATTCLLSSLSLIGCSSDILSNASDARINFAPSVSLDVKPQTITVGETADLAWTSTDSTSCIASGDWSGDKSIDGHEQLSPSSIGSLTYKLSCSGSERNATSTATLRVGTELSKRVESITAIDDSETPFGGTLIAGTLPEGGTEPAITTTALGTAYKGVGMYIRVKTPKPVAGLLVGTEGIAGQSSYYKIDFAQKTAKVFEHNDAEIKVDEASNSTVTIPNKDKKALKRYRAKQKAVDGLSVYDVVLGFSQDITEKNLNVSIVAVYEQNEPLSQRGSNLSSLNIDAKLCSPKSSTLVSIR